jgi:hypothetical protein
MGRHLVNAVAIAAAIALSTSVGAQQVVPQAQAGMLTCDVSAGIGLIITSQKRISCAWALEGSSLGRGIGAGAR